MFGSQSTEAFDRHDRASSLLLIFPLIVWETLIHAEDAALETESLPSHSFMKRCYRVKWVFPYTCFTDCPRVSTQSSNKLYLGPPGTEHWVWRRQRRRMNNPCYLAMGLSSQTHFIALQVFGKHWQPVSIPMSQTDISLGYVNTHTHIYIYTHIFIHTHIYHTSRTFHLKHTKSSTKLTKAVFLNPELNSLM